MTKGQKVIWFAKLAYENPHVPIMLCCVFISRSFSYGCIQLNRRFLTKEN